MTIIANSIKMLEISYKIKVWYDQNSWDFINYERGTKKSWLTHNKKYPSIRRIGSNIKNLIEQTNFNQSKMSSSYCAYPKKSGWLLVAGTRKI